jgi:hypothetical protein
MHIDLSAARRCAFENVQHCRAIRAPIPAWLRAHWLQLNALSSEYGTRIQLDERPSAYEPISADTAATIIGVTPRYVREIASDLDGIQISRRHLGIRPPSSRDLRAEQAKPMSDDPGREVWEAAVESHITAMSDADFAALVDRTRPPTEPDLPPTAPVDPTARIHGVRDSIATKAAQLRQAPHDHNGAITSADYGAIHMPNVDEPQPQPQGFAVNRGQGQSGNGPMQLETERERNARLIRQIREGNNQ